MSFWEKIAEKSKNWFKICYLFTKKLLFFIWQWMILCNKGTSINDVSSNFGFLDPLPPPVALLLALQITSKFHFYYPPPPQRRHCLWMVPKNSSDTKVRLMNYLHFSKILSILSDTFDHFLEKKKLQFWHISSTVRADLPKKIFIMEEVHGLLEDKLYFGPTCDEFSQVKLLCPLMLSKSCKIWLKPLNSELA